jgi:hypothetical protein
MRSPPAEATPTVAARRRSPTSGSGVYFANYGDDLHAVGSLAPLAPVLGCIVIRPDGSRVLARVVADPLAQQEPGADS